MAAYLWAYLMFIHGPDSMILLLFVGLGWLGLFVLFVGVVSGIGPGARPLLLFLLSPAVSEVLLSAAFVVSLGSFLLAFIILVPAQWLVLSGIWKRLDENRSDLFIPAAALTFFCVLYPTFPLFALYTYSFTDWLNT